MAVLDSRRDEFARLPAVCCFSRRFPLVSSLLIAGAECGAHRVRSSFGSRAVAPTACTVLHAGFSSSMSTPFLCLARPLVTELSQGRDARSDERLNEVHSGAGGWAQTDGVLCVSSYRGRTCGKATRIDLQTPSHGTGRALPWLLKAASAELRAGVTRRC